MWGVFFVYDSRYTCINYLKRNDVYCMLNRCVNAISKLIKFPSLLLIRNYFIILSFIKGILESLYIKIYHTQHLLCYFGVYMAYMK